MTSSIKRVLSIDIETYSDVDLDNGVYRYVDTPNFQILLFAYAFDDEPVEVVDVACGEDLPDAVLSALVDPEIEKHAFNAQFERICIQKHYGIQLPIRQWWCTQAHAAMFGLPASLKQVAQVLELAEQKDTAGTLLINYFTKPCRPTMSNGGRTRNLPSHDMAKWELFIKYCRQDVVTERAISQYLQENYADPADEKVNYWIDQKISDHGVRIDTDLCQAVISFNETYRAGLLERSNELTGLDNSNSLSQLKPWLQSRGLDADAVTKDTMPDLMGQTDDETVIEVLRIRQELAKTSVTKYQKMMYCVCSDGRVHGLLKFYGAGRTGRFAGRLIQVQNFPRNYMKELTDIRERVKARDWDYLQFMYDDIQDVFKQLLRTALIPEDGYVFAVADYSAIEARVVAWLAHETWAEEVFRGDGKIYEATAAQMFHVPVERIVKGNPEYELRQKGKVSTLALGYGGGEAALVAMGALKMGIPEEDLPGLVSAWRAANPHIAAFWTLIENAAKTAITENRTITLDRLKIGYRGGNLFIRLPSGRWLTYYHTRIDSRGTIIYDGNDAKGWGPLKTWGGKLTENVVQAIARDCLCDSIRKISDYGFRICFHIHDEIVCEVPEAWEETEALDGIGLHAMEQLMTGNAGTWDEGLYHPAPGYTTPYYMKD